MYHGRTNGAKKFSRARGSALLHGEDAGDGLLEAAEDPFDPASYEALLRLDLKRTQASFPEIFVEDADEPDWDDFDDEDEDE